VFVNILRLYLARKIIFPESIYSKNNFNSWWQYLIYRLNRIILNIYHDKSREMKIIFDGTIISSGIMINIL